MPQRALQRWLHLHLAELLDGEGQGERIEGTISNNGDIKITKREPGFNTCPICFSKGTLIGTPDGQIP
jgi:hypothetical protein